MDIFGGSFAGYQIICSLVHKIWNEIKLDKRSSGTNFGRSYYLILQDPQRASPSGHCQGPYTHACKLGHFAPGTPSAHLWQSLPLQHFFVSVGVGRITSYAPTSEILDTPLWHGCTLSSYVVPSNAWTCGFQISLPHPHPSPTPRFLATRVGPVTNISCKAAEVGCTPD